MRRKEKSWHARDTVEREKSKSTYKIDRPSKNSLGSFISCYGKIEITILVSGSNIHVYVFVYTYICIYIRTYVCMYVYKCSKSKERNACQFSALEKQLSILVPQPNELR